MFNFKNISKIVLITSALLFASFYCNPSFAQSFQQVGDDVHTTYKDGRVVVSKNARIGSDGKGNPIAIPNATAPKEEPKKPAPSAMDGTPSGGALGQVKGTSGPSKLDNVYTGSNLDRLNKAGESLGGPAGVAGQVKSASGPDKLSNPLAKGASAPAPAPASSSARSSAANTSSVKAAQAQQDVTTMKAEMAALNKKQANESVALRSNLNQAQEKMNAARTPDEIEAAKAELDKANKAFNDLNGSVKKDKEELTKALKTAEKSSKKATSEANKANKKELSAANDNLKDANKDLSKAEKDFKAGKIDAETLASARELQAKAAGVVKGINDRIADPLNKKGDAESLAAYTKDQAAKDAIKDAESKAINKKFIETAREKEAENMDAIKKEATTARAELEKQKKSMTKAEYEAKKKAIDDKEEISLVASSSMLDSFDEQLGKTKPLDKSKKDYQASRNDYEQAELAVTKAKKECRSNPSSSACGEVKTLEERAKIAKDAADAYYITYNKAQTKERNAQQAPQKAVNDAVNAEQKAKEELKKSQAKYEEAKKACEYSSNLTSKGGKADADKYCEQAAQLEKEVADKTKVLEDAKDSVTEAKDAQYNAMSETNPNEMRGMEYRAFGGEYTTFEGNGDGDVLKIITIRAFQFIVALKPIVYVLAGFGLIAFAFMAIFNKLSWKWFSNIAIGLFLVANMGRFIEYFVFPTKDLDDKAELKYGNHLKVGNISKGFADTTYEWVEEVTPYTPPRIIDGETPDSSATTPEEKKKDARGFCGKTAGASGWTNFSKCIKDVTAAGRKAVDAAQTVKSTVDKAKAGVESIKFAAQNIGDAVQGAKGGGLSGILKAAGQVGSSVNHMVGTTNGVIGGVMSGASKIANNVQDVSKSTDQVDELNRQRAKGEGTNAIDRLLKGQTVGLDGKVERDYKGNIISDTNAFNAVGKAADAINKKVSESNNMFQDGIRVGYDGAKLAEDTFGITDKLQDKKQQKAKKEAQKKTEERQAQQQQKQAEQKQKEQNIADERLVEQFKKQQEEAGKPATSTDKAKDAVKAAQEAAAIAKKAEGEAKQKANAANAADRAASSKNSAAEKAEANAKAAAEKAAASGSEADKATAVLAAKRADIAKSEAAVAALQAKNATTEATSAQEKANKAKEPLKELADGARSSVIEEAKSVQDKSQKEIVDAEGKAEVAKKALVEKEALVKKAKEDAAKAAAIAVEKQDVESIKAAQKAKEVAQAAENDAAKTQKEINDLEKRKKDAELRILNAKVFEEKIEAEKNLGLTSNVDKELQQKEIAAEKAQRDKIEAAEKLRKAQEEEAERLRQQYKGNTTPSKIADNANAKAQQAASAASQAALSAAQKEKQAETAKKQAEEAAKKAATSGDAVAQRAAAQAAKRAELAAKEAALAKEKAVAAKAPVAALEKTALSASINESKHIQEESRQEVAKADKAITDARANAQNAATLAKRAQDEAKKAAEVAAKSNSATDILAAKEKAKAASVEAQNAQAAQKKIDEEIRRRNEAELRVYEEATRQAELERSVGKKSNVVANNSGADVLSPASSVAQSRSASMPPVSPKTSGDSVANRGSTGEVATAPAPLSTRSVATPAQVAKPAPTIAPAPNARVSEAKAEVANEVVPTVANAVPVTRGVITRGSGSGSYVKSYESQKAEELLQEKDEEHQETLAEQQKKANFTAQSQSARARMETNAAKFRDEQEALVAQQKAAQANANEQAEKARLQEQVRQQSQATNERLQERDVKKLQQIRLERIRQMRVKRALEENEQQNGNLQNKAQ